MANPLTPEGPALLMDAENLIVRGWSHVVSPTDDVAALRAFAARVGAPRSALRVPARPWSSGRRPRLDLRGAPKRRALALDGLAVRVVPTTRDLVHELRGLLAREVSP